MIAGATRGQGGPVLARHLLSRKGGQRVELIEPRGLATADLAGQAPGNGSLGCSRPH